MYLYYCKHRECAGHIKGWERCDDRLASPAAQAGQASSAIFRAAAQPRFRETQPKASDIQDFTYGSDVTWV